MAIAVVIVNYNARAWIGRCLDALAAQSLPPARIIVVDNASSDRSTDCVSGRAGVELVRLGSNTGFAAACNRGVAEAADCDLIATLNPDAFPRPDWLETLARGAATYPAADMFACRMLDAGATWRLDGAGDAYHLCGIPWRRFHGKPAAGRALRSEEVFAPCAGAALYRRRAILEAGGFDEELFCYAEDVDLAFRIRLQGGGCVYLPDAVVEHVGSAITGLHSDFQLYHGHRNLLRVFVANMPSALFWPCLPLHVLMHVAALCWFSVKGRAGVMWRAKRDALRSLPAAWRRRRVVQAGRRISARRLWRVLHKGLPRVDRDG